MVSRLGQTRVEPQELSEICGSMVDMTRPLAPGFRGSLAPLRCRAAQNSTEPSKGREIAQPAKGSLIVNNCETMKQMVLAGIGVARLGLFHVAAEIAEGSCLCSKTAIQVTSN